MALYHNGTAMEAHGSQLETGSGWFSGHLRSLSKSVILDEASTLTHWSKKNVQGQMHHKWGFTPGREGRNPLAWHISINFNG